MSVPSICLWPRMHKSRLPPRGSEWWCHASGSGWIPRQASAAPLLWRLTLMRGSSSDARKTARFPVGTVMPAEEDFEAFLRVKFPVPRTQEREWKDLDLGFKPSTPNLLAKSYGFAVASAVFIYLVFFQAPLKNAVFAMKRRTKNEPRPPCLWTW